MILQELNWWLATDTCPNTYLLSHDICSLHNTLGQKSMTSSQYGCLLQGHTQCTSEHGNRREEIKECILKCTYRYVQDTYLLSMYFISYLFYIYNLTFWVTKLQCKLSPAFAVSLHLDSAIVQNHYHKIMFHCSSMWRHVRIFTSRSFLYSLEEQWRVCTHQDCTAISEQLHTFSVCDWR